MFTILFTEFTEQNVLSAFSVVNSAHQTSAELKELPLLKSAPVLHGPSMVSTIGRSKRSRGWKAKVRIGHWTFCAKSLANEEEHSKCLLGLKNEVVTTLNQ